MTTEYLAGELSLLLGRLAAVVPDAASGARFGSLRREVETGGPALWTLTVFKVFETCDELCWRELAVGNTRAFMAEARAASDLYELCGSAQLL